MTFEEIYSQNKNLVYNLALNYTQNTEDAEEISQDVFVSIHNKLKGFRQEANIKTWVYRITVNKSLDFIKLKKRKKRGGLFSIVNIETENQIIDKNTFNHPGVAIEQKEALRNIFACINQLPQNQKNVIILLKVEQLSNSEVAEILKLGPKAIESLYQRAKKNLEKLLQISEGK